MPRSTRHSCHRLATGLRLAPALALGAVLIGSTPAHSQDRPPLQEPIALEGAMKQFYRAANVVVVTTVDGMEHVYHFTKDLIVHGGKKPGVDALEGLREGTTVVIHYTNSGTQASAQEIDLLGDQGLKIAEGVVAGLDRRQKEITIRFANGETETLQMTTRAAAESDAEAGIDESSGEAVRIVVYYSDEAGHKIAHYFKKKS